MRVQTQYCTVDVRANRFLNESIVLSREKLLYRGFHRVLSSAELVNSIVESQHPFLKDCGLTLRCFRLLFLSLFRQNGRDKKLGECETSRYYSSSHCVLYRVSCGKSVMLKANLLYMKALLSFEYINVFTALLRDVQTLHSEVFTLSCLKGATKVALDRYEQEGMGFLTKTLPSLGKRFDQALTEVRPLEASDLRFKSKEGEKVPEFLRDLFLMVLKPDGTVRYRSHLDGGIPPVSVHACVQSLRQLLYAFYKLELPYDPKLEKEVVLQFKRTEEELRATNSIFQSLADRFGSGYRFLDGVKPFWAARTIRGAIKYLHLVFNHFDDKDIWPRHGPGAVSTRERLWHKYGFRNIPDRLADQYPIDTYFMASMGHVCDKWTSLEKIHNEENFARVVLVPKDSRGPRLISEEPLENQWIQQGLAQAMITHIESHPLTRDAVRFTDQEPNRWAARIGSMPTQWYLADPQGPVDMPLNGKYATLDLKEASDRVSLGLVRLLFPHRLVKAMEACRSLGTILPDGERLELLKFAPMGSALCFPVLALTIWALLRAGLEALNVPAQVIERVYVYGDDVIVHTAYAEHAMIILESFGLRINRDKSCTRGLFRESCGMDSFAGTPVTPVRFKTEWSSRRCPESFSSWVEYSNNLWERKYYIAYDYIVSRLIALYGPIPEKSLRLGVPSLYSVPEYAQPRSRPNHFLQKREWLVLESVPKKSLKEIDGWLMLLRFFEAHSSYHLFHSKNPELNRSCEVSPLDMETPVSVREYTWRRCNKLRRRWR